jgi:hypothetical protein
LDIIYNRPTPFKPKEREREKVRNDSRRVGAKRKIMGQK